MRKFLHGSSPGSAGKKSTAGQFGMELPQWDTADEEAVKQAAVFSRWLPEALSAFFYVISNWNLLCHL